MEKSSLRIVRTWLSHSSISDSSRTDMLLLRAEGQWYIYVRTDDHKKKGGK